MSDKLVQSRRRLRSLLLPASESIEGEHASDENHFPRSKVMRFAFNPRNRQVVMLAGSVLAVLATRAMGAGRLGMVTDIARSFSRFRSGGR